jgi:predicted membrane GTPase involved in stress response
MAPSISLKIMLSQINVINWIDFRSWQNDYNVQQIYDLYQNIKKNHGEKGVELVWTGLMEDE